MIGWMGMLSHHTNKFWEREHDFRQPSKDKSKQPNSNKRPFVYFQFANVDKRTRRRRKGADSSNSSKQIRRFVFVETIDWSVATTLGKAP